MGTARPAGEGAAVAAMGDALGPHPAEEEVADILLEDAAAVPLERDSLPGRPHRRRGDAPERLRHKADDALVALDGEVEGGRLAGAV